MGEQTLETDYLIIGAGAMGLAFADTLFHESPGSQMVIVDRRAAPGGHWTDAYPYVSLHQPAMFYGVNSQKLEHHRTDLASGSAIVDYFRRLTKKFTDSGRVKFLPLSEANTDGEVRSLVEPDQVTRIKARKRIVDASYMRVEVPAMRPPPFPVGDGVSVMPLNGLHGLRESWDRYVVMGGGKTGIDAVLFLLGMGIDQSRIHWVVPNDSWFWAREAVQAGIALGEFLRQMEAVRDASNIDELFLSLEKQGSVSRLRSDLSPTKWRCATISREELAQLKSIENVVRLGRIERIDADRIVMQKGEMATGPETLHIDCTANGLAKLPPVQVFDQGRITLQSLLMCQQVFSASLIARLEQLDLSDAERNKLCTVVPHPEQKEDLPFCMVTGVSNLLAANRKIPVWLRRSRLSLLAHEGLFNYLIGALRAYRILPGAKANAERLAAQTDG